MRPSFVVLALKSMLIDVKSIFHGGDSVGEVVGEVVVGEAVVGEAVVGEAVVGEAVVGEAVVGEAVVLVQVLVELVQSAQKGPPLSLLGSAVVEHAVSVNMPTKLEAPGVSNIWLHEHRSWLNFETPSNIFEVSEISSCKFQSHRSWLKSPTRSVIWNIACIVVTDDTSHAFRS